MIVRSTSLATWKAKQSILAVKVLKGPNGRFFAEDGGSVLGAVAKNFDSSKAAVVLDVVDEESGEAGLILANEGTSADYTQEALL